MCFAAAQRTHVFQCIQYVAAFADAIDNASRHHAVADVHDFDVIGIGPALDLVETRPVGAHPQTDKAVVEGNIEGLLCIFHLEMVGSDRHQLGIHVLFDLVLVEHGQHGIFGNDVEIATGGVLHLD
ncbi:hypothetical protein L473_00075 [Klebsiella pneumoniae BIDMC 36]|nr:hypothetical protein L473_00075 [Klebsiella pneumoniae BIDMC 36]SSM28271.1 Uncharacterised protein [Klebsiella pneumoniae]